MKKFFLTLVLTLIYLQTEAQIAQPNLIQRSIIQPILKDTDGVKIMYRLLVFSNHTRDENTGYKWRAWNTGIRMDCRIEHLDNIFLYASMYYQKSKHEDLYTAKPTISYDQTVILESGIGMRFPVELGNSGLFIEGEALLPFQSLTPSLECRFRWQHKKIGLTIGNKIMVSYASIGNPSIYFEYLF